MFHFIMLNGSSNSIACSKPNRGRTYFNPFSICCEGVRTIGTTEAMVRFPMLRKCW